jgi:hypothetical protein
MLIHCLSLQALQQVDKIAIVNNVAFSGALKIVSASNTEHAGRQDATCGWVQLPTALNSWSCCWVGNDIRFVSSPN